MAEIGNSVAGGAVRVARRKVLRVGVGAALLGPIFRTAGASALVEASDGELFAFRAPDAASLVIAVAFSVKRGGDHVAPLHSVSMHAGPECWTVKADDSPTTLASGARIFIGKTSCPAVWSNGPYHLAVVSAPLASLASRNFHAWAEVRKSDGSRQRIGGPIAAALVGRHPSLKHIFDSADRPEDRPRGIEVLAEHLLRMRAAAGYPLTEGHGERLAATLLPDTLRFDPSTPVGFTFAGQNGRHPSDRVADVVNAVLSGNAAVGTGAGAAFPMSDAFPYFQISRS